MQDYQWHRLFASESEAKQTIPLHSFSSFRVEWKKICVVHITEGFFAIEDLCPHKLIPLSKGALNAQGNLVCMWHQYTFDVCTGQEVTAKNIRNVKTFPLEFRQDGVFVGIPLKIQPKDEFSY
jgi:nitrite reductase/ring-hydroxylating ferredoxin subunit